MLVRYRSEEHTSELQSPYVISYAVFCLKKKRRGCRGRGRGPVVAPQLAGAHAVLVRSRFRWCLASRAGVSHLLLFFFFFNDAATTEIYPLSLPDALPI